MRSQSVLLIIGGGIAAYKSLELIRRLKERGIASRSILTKAGCEFVTPLSVSALTGEKVYTDLFSLTDEAEMGHIQLSRSADLVVVAPATADLMAKLANGLANDLASTALLATDKPVLMAPSMNVRMWNQPATRRNLKTLKNDGVLFVGPNDGEMACGEYGPGRMAEPEEIAAAIETALAAQTTGPLAGLKALVTAGPTHEPLDPVRFIANRSSGKQGYAIADALARAGAQTILVSGPVDIAAPPRVKLLRVETAREMLAACEVRLAGGCGGVYGGRRRLASGNRSQQQDQENRRNTGDQADRKPGHSFDARSRSAPPRLVDRLCSRDRERCRLRHRKAVEERLRLDRRQRCRRRRPGRRPQ